MTNKQQSSTRFRGLSSSIAFALVAIGAWGCDSQVELGYDDVPASDQVAHDTDSDDFELGDGSDENMDGGSSSGGGEDLEPTPDFDTSELGLTSERRDAAGPITMQVPGGGSVVGQCLTGFNRMRAIRAANAGAEQLAIQQCAIHSHPGTGMVQKTWGGAGFTYSSGGRCHAVVNTTWTCTPYSY